MTNEVFILDAKRTPVASFLGAFQNLSAPQLGAAVIKSMTKNFAVAEVDACIIGNVLTAGLGQAPARQSAIFGGLPKSVDCLTINKVCSSGLKAVMLGADSIQLKQNELVISGGQENMSMSPHLLENSRSGYRMGPVQSTDSMIKDGLWDPYKNFHMGMAGEMCAKKYSFTRQAQDEFALESYRKAQKAIKEGLFKNEIIPVEILSKKGNLVIDTDEEPMKAQFDKIPTLKPAFDKEGSITAANASKLNDGASMLVLASKEKSQKLGVKPIAKIISYGTFSHEPEWFTTAPIGAIKKVLAKAGLDISQIDLWEINEAFSVVTLAAIKELNLDPKKVNVHGGAVAIGHPIGASGARILTTLIHSLKTYNKKYGLATLCNGGGEATALVVECL